MKLLFAWLGFFLTATVGQDIQRWKNLDAKKTQDCGWKVQGFWWDDTQCNTVLKPKFIEVIGMLAVGGGTILNSRDDLSDRPHLHSAVTVLQETFEGGTHYVPNPLSGENLMNYQLKDTLYPSFMITRAQYAPKSMGITNCFGLKLTTSFTVPENFRKHGATKFAKEDAVHAESRRQFVLDFEYHDTPNRRCTETGECSIHFVNGKPSINNKEVFTYSKHNQAISMYYFFGPGETIPWQYRNDMIADNSPWNYVGHLWNGEADADSRICTPLIRDIGIPGRKCRNIFFVYVRYVWNAIEDFNRITGILNKTHLLENGPSPLTPDIWNDHEDDWNGDRITIPGLMIRGELHTHSMCRSATFRDFRQSSSSSYVKLDFDPVIGHEMGIYSDAVELTSTLFGGVRSSQVTITVYAKYWAIRESTQVDWEDAYFIVDPCGRVDHMGRGALEYDDKIAKVMCSPAHVNSVGVLSEILDQCVSPESQNRVRIRGRDMWGRNSHCFGFVNYWTAENICSNMWSLEKLDWDILWGLPNHETDFSKCCTEGIGNENSDFGNVGSGWVNGGITCSRDWESSMIWTSIPWTRPSDDIIDFLGPDFYDWESHSALGKPRGNEQPGQSLKLELTSISGPPCEMNANPGGNGGPAWGMAFRGYAQCSAIAGPGEELKVSLSYEHTVQMSELSIYVEYEQPSADGNTEWYQVGDYFRIGIHEGLYMQIYLTDDADPFSSAPYHSVFLPRGSINFDIVDIDSFLPETIHSSNWGVLLKGSFRTENPSEFCNLGLYSAASSKGMTAKWDGQSINQNQPGLSNPLDSDNIMESGTRNHARIIYWQVNIVQHQSYDYEFRVWDTSFPRLLWLDLRWWCASHKLTAKRDYVLGGNSDLNFPPIPSPSSTDLIYLHRVVPRECFISRSGSPVVASPPRYTNTTCWDKDAQGILPVDYSLQYAPSDNVVISFNSPLTLDVCTMTFTPNNYNIGQTLRFSTYNRVPLIDSNSTYITGTAKSNDPRFDGFDIVVNVQGGSEWGSPCFFVGDFSEKSHACFVSVDGAVRSYSDWERYEPRQIAKHSYVWLVKSDENNFHIQARADECSGQACVTGATIHYHGDVYSVYKDINNDFLTLNHLGNVSPSDPILDLVEDGDCWIFSSASGIRAEFCVVDKQFVDIFVYIPPGGIYKVPSVEGLCFGDLNDGYPNAASCNLNFYPEITPPRTQDPSNVPFLPKGCGVNWRPRDGLNQSHNIEKSPTNTNFRDNVRFKVPPPAQALSKKRIKLISNVDIERFSPRELGKLCSTPASLKAQGGTFLKNLLFGDPGKTTCERLQKSGHELRVALQSSRQLVYGIIQYFMWTGGLDKLWNSDLFKEYVTRNPHLCGPFAEFSRSGCMCKDGGTFPTCEGVTFEGEANNNAPQRCPSYVSVIVDQYTGQVWKCYKGYCQYSYNGAHWIGMPKNLETPYCIVALSWSDSEKTQDQTLWAYSNTGAEIASTDQGITWSVLTHSWSQKTESQTAITQILNPHGNEEALLIDGVSKVVPHDAFPGRGSDKWWLTTEELCVKSQGLSAWHDSMIACSKWFCQCVDAEAWLSTFGVPVPDTPEAPVAETSPNPADY
jgi:hypothetical protein